MNEKPKVKIIGKETGDFPPPTIRKIYPARALLWKYYLKTVLAWILIGIVVFSILSWFLSGEMEISTKQFYQDVREMAWIFYWISIIGILIPMLILYPFYVKNMEYVIHGDYCSVKKGLINRTIKFCPFRTMTNISTRIGPIDRVFGIGNVFVETAGKSGQNTGPEEKLEGLPLYHEIRDYILKQIRVYNTGYTEFKNQGEVYLDKKALQTEYLTELREINQILKEKQR
ncbi:MAG: PH domain-containing protein [Candidatus Hodarchaeales archaeon]